MKNISTLKTLRIITEDISNLGSEGEGEAEGLEGTLEEIIEEIIITIKEEISEVGVYQ